MELTIADILAWMPIAFGLAGLAFNAGKLESQISTHDEKIKVLFDLHNARAFSDK